MAYLVILKLKKQLNSNLNNKNTKVVVEEVKILTENVGINNSRLNEQIENKTLQELIIDLNIKNMENRCNHSYYIRNNWYFNRI